MTLRKNAPDVNFLQSYLPTDISAACHESPVAGSGLRRRSTTTEKNSHANKSEEISTPTYCPTTGNSCCTLTSYFVIKFAIYSFLILSSSELSFGSWSQTTTMTVRSFYFYVLNYRPVDSLFSVLNVARAGFPKNFWVDLKDSAGNYDFSSRFQSIFVTLVLDQEMLIRNRNLLAEVSLGKSTKIWRNRSTF
jgi:hypothetical protein